MKIRIRFSKTGAMRYVGHLDTMHYFQKAFRRTGLRLGFSKGFSPHMLLTFASPLSIGMTTTGDYLDIVIEEEVSPSEVLQRLNLQLGEGFEATDAVRLREDAKTPMALLRAASYRVTGTHLTKDCLREMIRLDDDFMAQPEIVVIKKTKKGEREENIRPLIYGFNSHTTDSEVPGLDIMCASGSIEHLKPELIMDAFSAYCSSQGLRVPLAQNTSFLWYYHRCELYGVDPRILKPGEPLGDHQPVSFITLDI